MREATFQKEVVFVSDCAFHASQADTVRGTAYTHVWNCAVSMIVSVSCFAISGICFDIFDGNIFVG